MDDKLLKIFLPTCHFREGDQGMEDWYEEEHLLISATEESVDSSENDVSQMIILGPPSLYLPRRSCATVILGSAFLSRQSCESHKVFFM